MKNSIFLRRRNKIVLLECPKTNVRNTHVVATMLKNIESLGYTFSKELIEKLTVTSDEFLMNFYLSIVPVIKQLKGAHVRHRPMYPNFPEQVMNMTDAELYINAIVHYITSGALVPHAELKERFPLLDNTALTVINIGTKKEFESLFGAIVSSNTSLSVQDKEDVLWFVENYKNDIERLLPDSIPQKENVTYLASLLMQHTSEPAKFVNKYCRTATDILRLAVALSGGDISLVEPTRFRNFKKSEVKLFMSLLDAQPNATEDVLRHAETWKRLAAKFHVGDFKKSKPNAFAALDTVQNNRAFTTKNSLIETALIDRDVQKAVDALVSRPGDFARRLDHLLRLQQSSQSSVAKAFQSVSAKVSTPVLLQVRQHFITRNQNAGVYEVLPKRVFFPKGNVAKVKVLDNNLPHLSSDICNKIITICDSTLINRFSAMPELGNCYLDHQLADYLLPFSQRSASKALKTIVRGSRIPIEVGAKTLRFFIWWKNGQERTDIDLSAASFDENFNYAGHLSYTNLRGEGGYHSGDIVDAPKGASEFIDINLDAMRKTGARFVVMNVYSYTNQPYCDLPECFAGWMARSSAKSGEIYEPKTVKNKIDLTANTKVAIPLVIDLVAMQVIWCDMSLKSMPNWVNNVEGNLGGVQATLKSFVDISKPNMFDLLNLHIQARGRRVNNPDDADVVFSVENETPFRLEEIAANYMS